jgi:hypothetical protein
MRRLNRNIRREYNRLYGKNPTAANLFLLLTELADKRGRVQATEAELSLLMAARFEDPKAYQLPGGPKP